MKHRRSARRHSRGPARISLPPVTDVVRLTCEVCDRGEIRPLAEALALIERFPGPTVCEGNGPHPWDYS